MTKITKYIILIFLLALQVVYLIEIIERVSLNKWSDIFFPCIFFFIYLECFLFISQKSKIIKGIFAESIYKYALYLMFYFCFKTVSIL